MQAAPTELQAFKDIHQPQFQMYAFVLQKTQVMPGEKTASEGMWLAKWKGQLSHQPPKPWRAPKATNAMGWWKVDLNQVPKNEKLKEE